NAHADLTSRSTAVYGDATYSFTDKTDLTVGLRYTRDEKDFVLTIVPNDFGFGVVYTATPGVEQNRSWNNLSTRVVLDHELSADAMVYASYATGYKSGGFNPRASGSVPFRPFDEETLLAYEAGLKSQWFDSRLQLNFAAFYSDYENLQTDIFTANSFGAGSETVNAGKAKIPGVELEALALPFEGVTLSLNYGWMNPKYEDLLLRHPLTNDFVDMSDGAKFGYRPDQTLAAAVTYTTQPVGSLGLVLSAGLDVRYTDDVFWHQVDFAPDGAAINRFNDLIHADAYPLLNAHLTVSEIALGDRATLKATVYGRNITDEEYITAGIDFGVSGFAGANFGEPASWGVDLTVEF
ncbi:MAG TPA: TonB-dependent receptor, partial [Myxococcota bacterium]|nr:TonB-dependent receptor [Myxococcota bacterium]